MGKKTNRHDVSFHHKISSAQTAGETSRESRLAHRQGLTVALEYPSQGHPEGGRNEAQLEGGNSRSYSEYARPRQVGREESPLREAVGYS